MIATGPSATPGATLDWEVAGWVTVAGGLLALALQVWELTHLRSSRFERVRVVFHRLGDHEHRSSLGAIYWLVPLLARSIRLHRALIEEGATGRELRAERLFRANADGCTLFWGFVAFIRPVIRLFFYAILGAVRC